MSHNAGQSSGCGGDVTELQIGCAHGLKFFDRGEEQTEALQLFVIERAGFGVGSFVPGIGETDGQKVVGRQVRFFVVQRNEMVAPAIDSG